MGPMTSSHLTPAADSLPSTGDFLLLGIGISTSVTGILFAAYGIVSALATR